ncbi:response regulator [Leptothoe kymatousa]|uniref:Response regulator n=1 Tax=Leptothoe kymatousa TAU-MAC 1615 TaxID=2364775 RepID=A0ABS5Y6I0_9CYAN|nr:response regulator [Leptothoe kymatousa]MBT9312959.1 response regulator [Leptothoe kymatousa TAU-MAC 1615]
MKILVVEDDAGLAEILDHTLKQHHYQTEMATDGEAGWQCIELFEYDLVLLDLYLPKLDGISFCRKLRTSGYAVPVLLMTAEDALASKVTGLDAGADDYIIKPLDLDELLARMRALLRRGQVQTSPLITWGQVTLNPTSCEVLCQEKRLHLTGKEYALLELLLRHRHRIFSLNTLIDRLWSFEKMPSENAVRTHVKSLRRKLRQGGVEDMIETVYGLGYRLRPEPVAPSPEPVAPTKYASLERARSGAALAPQDPVVASLKTIWERHQSKYLDLIESLAQSVQLLQDKAFDPSTAIAQNQLELAAAQKVAHRLKGALGSFGFTTASQLAARIEQVLLVTPLPNGQHLQQLPSVIEQLRQALPGSTTVNSHRASQLRGSGIHQWLIIDNDIDFVDNLIHEASVWGVQPWVASTVHESKELLQQHNIDIVLLDINVTGVLSEGMALLLELTQLQPQLSVIVATDQDSLRERATALRAGAKSFLPKPVAAAQVLKTLIHHLGQTTLPAASILALDDDPQILECLDAILRPWGFQLTLVSDPLKFWDSLEQAPPDLMILDIEMPDFNGLEMCQVIRNDPALHQFPILFLSGHTEPDIVRRVFEVGADDYLSKPIIGPELVARILNRLERVRLLRTLAEVDQLTGLSQRHQSVKDFNRLLKLADRQQTTLCFALLDLDQFKAVNDYHGHDVGDQVLKTLGDYLRKTFRGEDVLARWGGEEFVVGLYGISKDVAVQRLTMLLQTFRQHGFLGDTKSLFHVSFSGGVAEYPQHGKDVQSLYRVADKALYKAKAAGRNQVLSS